MNAHPTRTMPPRSTRPLSGCRFAIRRCAVALPLALGLCTGMVDQAPAQQTFTVRGTINVPGDASQVDRARAVVFLDAHPALPIAGAADGRPQVAQRNKAFVPDLLVVSRGTSVEFPNFDPYSHNVFSRSRTAPFDLDRYPQGVSKSYTFNQPGLVQLFCNIHPNMRAVILVVPNRYFGRADARGRFALDGVPAGRYTLVAWHELCGSQPQTIQVGPGPSADVAVTLPAPRAVAVRAATPRRGAPGIDRGLGLKRDQLDLPVVREQHPAPQRGR